MNLQLRMLVRLRCIHHERETLDQAMKKIKGKNYFKPLNGMMPVISLLPHNKMTYLLMHSYHKKDYIGWLHITVADGMHIKFWIMC